MRRIKTSNLIIFVILPLATIFSLFYVTFKPFTIQTTATVEIDIKDNSIGTYNGQVIEKTYKNHKYNLAFKNVVISWDGKKKIPVLEVRCTEDQMKKLSNLSSIENYLQLECSIFDRKHGKLVGIYEDSPWGVGTGVWKGQF